MFRYLKSGIIHQLDEIIPQGRSTMFESFNALRNEPMSAHTTLKLGGPADYLVFPRSREEIAALFAEAGAYNLPVTVIGHGSNLLVLDGGIRGLVISVGKNMREIRREGNLLTAQGGAMLGALANEAAEARRPPCPQSAYRSGKGPSPVRRRRN